MQRGYQTRAASAQLAPAPKGVPAVVSKPQHQSKKQTPLANDPLYMEAFVIEGDKGFVEEAGRKVFSPSFESFISLIERTYTQVCTTDKQFQRHVSLSMYVYCNVAHLHARIAAIRQHTGRSVEDENNLIFYMKSEDYPVYEPVNAFLRGLGDFEDPSGTYHHFSIRQIPTPQAFAGFSGYYGRIDRNTHAIYECYPAPGIAAQRIIEDYLYTIDNNRGPIWNVPDGIQHDGIQHHSIQP